MELHSTYYNTFIWKNTSPGYALRYTACGGLAADTLAGIKELIREREM